jgi:alkanesulfonate monooxygenase SsuD/methylene tetrahydromethanopterin reductase-like flavin-dependent oxidoreductase (luciferase family)
MAEFADRCGITLVNVEEHHCAKIGWLPSPLTMAGLVIGRTRRVEVRASALLITLYDPIRLAEDIAMLHLASAGRFSLIAGQGYRPLEYHALDRDWERRGENTEFILETLSKAWTGKPFEYKGQRVQISPAPDTPPRLHYGGMSKIAARRAARLGLPFFPPAELPELIELYRAEAQRLGHTPRVEWPRPGTGLIFIDENPDAAWAELGPHFLAEAVEYSSWHREGVERPFEGENLTLEQLREQQRYEIITPAECRRRIEQHGGDYTVILHPLAGGVPLPRAWDCLRLYAEQVLQPLGIGGAR